MCTGVMALSFCCRLLSLVVYVIVVRYLPPTSIFRDALYVLVAVVSNMTKACNWCVDCLMTGKIGRAGQHSPPLPEAGLAGMSAVVKPQAPF